MEAEHSRRQQNITYWNDISLSGSMPLKKNEVNAITMLSQAIAPVSTKVLRAFIPNVRAGKPRSRRLYRVEINTALKTAKIKGAMISEIPLLPLSSTPPAPPDTSRNKLLCDDEEGLAPIGWSSSFSNTPDLPGERWTVFLLDFGTPPFRRKVDPSTKHLLVDSATVLRHVLLATTMILNFMTSL